MSLTVIEPPAEPVVSLPELKAFLRVDGDEEDGLITSLAEAAEGMVRSATGRTLATTTYQLTLGGFPRYGARLILQRPPILSVESVTYRDKDGTERELHETANYYIANATDVQGEPPALVPVSSHWPGTAEHPEAVTITYKAGYGTGADVPHRLRLAIMALTAHWYETREPVVVGGNVSEVPHHVGRLMSSMRLWERA